MLHAKNILSIARLCALLAMPSLAQTPPPLVDGLPQLGYILWNQPEGIYRYTFPGKATRRLVDKGKSPKINLASGNRIVYVAKLANGMDQVRLMDPEGENQKDVGPAFSSIFEIDWTAKGTLTFTAGKCHVYGGSQYWCMDTLGNATRVSTVQYADSNQYGFTKFVAGNGLALTLMNTNTTTLYQFDQANPTNGMKWIAQVGPCGLNVSADYQYFTNCVDATHKVFKISTFTNPPVLVKEFDATMGNCESPAFTNYNRYAVICNNQQNIYFLDLDAPKVTFVTSYDYPYEPYFADGGSYPVGWVGTWASKRTDWPLFSIKETNDIGASTVAISSGTTARIFYRTDGGTPDSTSTLYTVPFTVSPSDSIVIKAIAYETGAASSLVQTCVVRKLQMRAPENPANLVPGLSYLYYELTNPTGVADLDTATPKSNGSIADFSIPTNHRQDNWGYTYLGYISIPQTGRYKFYLRCGDAGALYIGSTLVVNNFRSFGSVLDSGSIGLQAGHHAISLLFYNDVGGYSLEAYYCPPGGAVQAIPASALYHVGQTSQQNITISSLQAGQVFTLGQTVPVTITYAPSMPVILQFSGDGGKSFVNITKVAIRTELDGSCTYSWTIPSDKSYLSTQAVLMVADYVMPSINAQTDCFAIQEAGTAAQKGALHDKLYAQLHISNGQISMSGTGGLRCELFGLDGRFVASTSPATNRTASIANAGNKMIICRIATAGTSTARFLPAILSNNGTYPFAR